MAALRNSRTAVWLPDKIVQKILGKGNRSRFIAAAIEKELKRQARLAHLADEGFIADDLDALAFVDCLRAADVR